MQNYCKTIGAIAAASALVAGNVSAEVEYELHTGYTSEYVWRGIDLGDDLIEAGVDVAGEWNNVGLSAGAWYGSFQNADISVDELDIYGEASYDLGFMNAAIGYVMYHLPNQGGAVLDDSQELYFSASRDFGFVNASLTYFWDIETDNNGYSELALDRSFELSPCLTLNLATNLGYQVEEGQCTAWTTKVGLDWAFAETAKLSPFVALAVALSDDNDSTYTPGSENELVAGSMLSVSF